VVGFFPSNIQVSNGIFARSLQQFTLLNVSDRHIGTQSQLSEKNGCPFRLIIFALLDTTPYPDASMKLPKNMKLTCLPIPAFAAALLFIGCSGEDPRVAPLKDDIQSAVQIHVPPYVALVEMETEVIPVKEDQVKINFKAKVKVSEDLYIGAMYIAGEERFDTLKITQSAGTEEVLYGSLFAKRTMDKWDTTTPEFNSGLSRLGRPRGAFRASAVVEGSAAFKGKLKDIKEARAEEVRLQKENQRKNEEARLALIEKQKAEKAARRQKLLDAVAVGKSYEGTVDSNNSGQRGRVELVFTKLSGFLIEAELSNPDDTSQKCVFSGEVIFDDKQNQNSSGYNFVLSQKSKKPEDYDILAIYWRNSTIYLSPTDEGLFGVIKNNTTWNIRLQPKP